MTDALVNLNENDGLLRVAFPRARNSATNTQNSATGHATATQQVGLKALALLALERNKPRNNHATGTQKATQQTAVLEGDSVARVARDSGTLRNRLLRIAHVELIAPELVHALQDDDVMGCSGLADECLRAYLRGLRDDDLRERGKRPADETAAALCRSCGPVWLRPAVVAVAPMVDGWPRALGCPWCQVVNRRAIPRPPVACGDCRHFIRDAINPDGGMGRCGTDRVPLSSEPLAYPHAQRQCDRFAAATMCAREDDR